MILVLGIIDIPYAQAGSAMKKVKKAPKGKATAKAAKPKKAPAQREETTGEVASALEEKYQIMQHFFDEYEGVFMYDLIEDLEKQIFNLNNGSPVFEGGPFKSGLEKMKVLFVQFLDDREIEHLGIPGVPTKAALDGVQSKFKLFKGERRASFIDTGLYQQSFKAWTE